MRPWLRCLPYCLLPLLEVVGSTRSVFMPRAKQPAALLAGLLAAMGKGCGNGCRVHVPGAMTAALLAQPAIVSDERPPDIGFVSVSVTVPQLLG